MKPRARPGIESFRVEMSSADAERLWEQLPAARVRRRTRRMGGAMAVVAAAAVTIGVAWPRTSDPTSLTMANHAPVAVGRSFTLDAPLVFSDGSRFSSLGTMPAVVEVVANRADRFSTLVTQGSISVEVTPGGPRVWVVETDLATIEVVGTGFDVRRDATGLDVSVRHGIVAVSGERVPGRTRTLTANQTLHIPADTLAVREAVAPVIDRPTSEPSTPPALPAPARTVARSVASGPSVDAGVVDSERGESQDAGAAETGLDSGVGRVDLDIALDHFSELRQQHRTEEAVSVLTEAIERATSPAEAATLRFELGRFLRSVGRTDQARTVLARVQGPGVPPELAAAARSLLDAAP